MSDERIFSWVTRSIDTLRQQIGRARQMPLPGGLAPGEYAVLTLHRPANVDSVDRLSPILGAINEIAERIPVVFPVHPRTARAAGRGGVTPPHSNRRTNELSAVPRAGCARARMVLTDSGGIQEETTVLGIPCLTMRPNTERPITCEIGTNILVGTDPQRIVREARSILDGHTRLGAIPEKWDGCAGERIVEVLLSQPVSSPPLYLWLSFIRRSARRVAKSAAAGAD